MAASIRVSDCVARENFTESQKRKGLMRAANDICVAALHMKDTVRAIRCDAVQDMSNVGKVVCNVYMYVHM